MTVAYVCSEGPKSIGKSYNIIGMPGIPLTGQFIDLTGDRGSFAFALGGSVRGFVNRPPQNFIYGHLDERVLDERVLDERATDLCLLHRSLVGGFIFDELESVQLSRPRCQILFATTSVLPLHLTINVEKFCKQKGDAELMLQTLHATNLECGPLLPLEIRCDGSEVAWGIFSLTALNLDTGEGEGSGVILHSEDWDAAEKYFTFHRCGRLIGAGRLS